MDAESRSAAEDLALIRHLMEDTQDVVRHAGAHFLVWGLLMSAALLITWAALARGLGVGISLTWAVAVGLGWAFSFVYGWRSQRRRRVSTLGGHVLMGIWVGHGIAITLLAFLGIATGQLAPGAVNPVFGAMFGAAYFATSFVTRLSWLRLAAAAWWVGAAAMLVWPGAHTYLLTAGLVLALVVAPGIHLRLGRSGRSVGSAA